MSAELTPEQIAAWGKASRAASGVPPKIEDPTALARLTTLALVGADTDDSEDVPAGARRRKPNRRRQPTPAKRGA